MNTITFNTNYIKQQAQELGFNYCGIAKAEFLNDDARRLEHWLNKGFNGTMQYMENYFDLRVNPQKIVPGAKSVITLLQNYYPEQQQQNNNYKVAKYAYGKDYHEIIRAKLKQLLANMNATIGSIDGRGFVDSAPVLERAWAIKSGLGWIGKNGNLITKQSGSFFFIATIIVDIELLYDDAYAKDFCGSCTKCIDHCPTNAILPNKVIDGSKCISYYTIELKDALINENMKGKFDNWMFGCDTCQDVCPWNRFSSPTNEINFTPIPEILNFTNQQWEELTEESFKQIFKESPLKRTKYKGIKRNLQFIQSTNDTV
ncbi:MAG: tRNA epoxyqueuosine(34) reductase QueG [Chitinophagaceae bacterium]|nr:tRNA epoxyqueuosine(34) reductase QueG [Chitinophagaceae bacterium]